MRTIIYDGDAVSRSRCCSRCLGSADGPCHRTTFLTSTASRPWYASRVLLPQGPGSELTHVPHRWTTSGRSSPPSSGGSGLRISQCKGRRRVCTRTRAHSRMCGSSVQDTGSRHTNGAPFHVARRRYRCSHRSCPTSRCRARERTRGVRNVAQDHENAQTGLRISRFQVSCRLLHILKYKKLGGGHITMVAFKMSCRCEWTAMCGNKSSKDVRLSEDN